LLREHALERRDDLLGAGLRLAVRGPEVPRPEHHQRLGEQTARVEVVGIARATSRIAFA
jgi:hypothetical protein